MEVFDSRKRQEITNVYRRCPNSVLHFNYQNNTATVTTNGVDEHILIFGSTVELLAMFTENKTECSTKEIFMRMNERYPKV